MEKKFERCKGRGRFGRELILQCQRPAGHTGRCSHTHPHNQNFTVNWLSTTNAMVCSKCNKITTVAKRDVAEKERALWTCVECDCKQEEWQKAYDKCKKEYDNLNAEDKTKWDSFRKQIWRATCINLERLKNKLEVKK